MKRTKKIKASRMLSPMKIFTSLLIIVRIRFFFGRRPVYRRVLSIFLVTSFKRNDALVGGPPRCERRQRKTRKFYVTHIQKKNITTQINHSTQNDCQ